MATLLTGNGYYPVTAQQDADLYQGIIGGDHVKVLPVGGQMAYTLSENTVTIADGECVDSEGRRYHIDVWTSDTVTIPTGTVGVTKYYIIGFVVSTDTSGNQTADTFYQEVDYASSTIDEDLLRDGNGTKYVSLYRLTQAGVSVTDVTALFEVSRSLNDLEEDIDDAVESIDSLGDELDERAPFKLGISDDGTYGYIKNGSTEVTGFRYPTGDATAADLLAGKVASSFDEEDFTGTMPDNGTIEVTLNAGESYTLAEGHYDESTITAATLASQVSGTAESSDMLAGTSAYVDGVLVEGTMEDHGTVSATLNCDETYTIEEGHYDGGTVTANSLASQTVGTATASDIADGETAWVNGEQITGTATFSSSDSGSGSGSDTGSDSDSYDLAELTPGTATAADIIYGETAWVDGEQITGTMTDYGSITQVIGVGESSTYEEGHYDSITIQVEELSTVTNGTATASDILEGKTAWVNGEKLTGTLVVSTETSYAVDGETTDGTYYIDSGGTVIEVVIESGEVTSISGDVSDGEYTLYSDENLTEDSGLTLSVTNETTVETDTDSGEVTFIDHDGTVLYSYSRDDFAELTALPDLPNGWTAGTDWGFEIPMTCTGWNWSLESIQNYTGKSVTVGAVYEPTDGKTHLIYFAGVQWEAQLCLTCSTDDAAVIIDWGDGTATETTSADETTYTHDYGNETEGFYDITITANNGEAYFTALNPATISSSAVGCLNEGADSIYGSALYGLYVGEGIISINISAFVYCWNLAEVTISDRVAFIGGLAFSCCTSLTSISLPASITSIGTYAFDGCSSLMSISLPEGVTSIGSYAFHGCYSITSISIPEGVTSIGNYVFQTCYSLASISIPEGVTSIGSYAFYDCYSLASISLPGGVTSIGSSAFYDCRGLTSISVPDGVTSIGSSAFRYCTSLAAINIPDGVTSIQSNTFYYCSSLSSISLPDGVTSIGGSAFYFCKALASINIPEGVTSIGTSAFYGCASLTSINIPDGVTSIGDNTFYQCNSLMSISLSENVTSIGDYAFYECTSLTSINIPDGVTSIGIYAFAECYALKSLTVPDGVIRISNSVVLYCCGLTSITIPESVTSIDSRSLEGCSSLTSVSIPESVTSIGTYAFSGCLNLYRLDGLIVSATATSMFAYCYRLTNLTNVVSVAASVSFSRSPLSYDSVINLFNALDEDNTGTLTLSSDSYALLSDDDLAIATDKGWTVASA